MNSLFKFPRRVRIHGGECGAVARALHHKAQKVALTQNEQTLISDECVLKRQADLEKSSISTFNERKQMSTKTSIKRVALVAVSALGFGLLSVVPARAANSATTINGLATTTIVMGGVDATISSTVADNDDVAYQFTVTPDGFAPGDDDAFYGGDGANKDRPAGLTSTTFDTFTTAGVLENNGTTATLVIPNSMLKPGLYTVKLGAGATAANADTELGGTDAGDTVSWIVAPAVTAGVVSASTDAPFYTLAANTAGSATLVASKPAGTGAFKAEVLTAPTGAAAFVVGYKGSGFTITDRVGAGTNATAATIVIAYNGTAGADTLSTAGSYGIRIWADNNGDGSFTSGELSTTVSVSFGGAATATGSSISLSRSITVNTDDDTDGSIGVANTETLGNAAGTLDNFRVTVTCADTDGNPASCTPTLNEDVDESSIGSNQAMTRVGNTNTYIFDAAVTSGGDSTVGYTDAKVTLRLDGTVTTKSSTYRNVFVADVITQLEAVDAVGIGTVGSLGKEDLFKAGVASTSALPAAEAITVDKAVTSITYKVTAPATEAGRYIVVLRRPAAVGTSLSVAPETVTVRRLGSDAAATWSEAVTGAAADSYTISVLGTSGTGATETANAAIAVTYATAAPAITVSPSAAVLAKDGASTTFSGSLADQFGRVQAAKTVFYSVAGRNPSNGSITTGADGSFGNVVVTDSSGVATTLLTPNTDTITWTYNYSTSTGAAASATGSQKVTYSLTGPSVASVAVTSATTTMQIDQAKVASVPARYTTYTATVRKADNTSSGAGILCTWSGGAGDLFENGINTSVTDADGLCTIKAYRDLAGSSAIKASAVGISSNTSLPVKWVNQGDIATATGEHDGRYIAVTAGTAVAGTPVTVMAKVTDRWGNPVSGVDVTFALSGVGRLVSGDSLAKETNVNGEAQIQVVSSDSETGTNTVSASFTGSQSGDIAGYVTVNNTSTPGTAAGADTQTLTAVTGVTAAVKSASGTVTFTKNTSVSTADALLELAKAIGTGKSVEEAADAAAEAIDAANAATDAANLAAEAADAATVAAEEARDAADSATAAVEELATQVATLMAALKAQLTTLANTVAKIAKKVKA